jgi:hypothetical protein
MRLKSSSGTITAVTPKISRTGLPLSLSKSGSIPATPHNAPASAL